MHATTDAVECYKHGVYDFMTDNHAVVIYIVCEVNSDHDRTHRREHISLRDSSLVPLYTSIIYKMNYRQPDNENSTT